MNLNINEFLNQRVSSDPPPYSPEPIKKVKSSQDSCQTYVPIHWLLYGGLQAQWLKYLTSISVWYMVNCKNCLPMGIEFEYSEAVDGSSTHVLGRKGPFTLGDYHDSGLYKGRTNEYNDKVIRFEIDGPGGEYINGSYILELTYFAFGVSLQIRRYWKWLAHSVIDIH